jgi:argininosuccinate lyase
LPLAYNRDLQEDKHIVFHADDTVAGSIEAMKALLTGSEFGVPAPSPGTAALPLAERLVGRGVPFREAHHLVGEVVNRLEGEGRTLAEATIDDLKTVDDRFDTGDLDVLHFAPPPIGDQLTELRMFLE